MNPDVLVLGGGGILGEAWMSAVLAGLQEAGSFRGDWLSKLHRDIGRAHRTRAPHRVKALLSRPLLPNGGTRVSRWLANPNARKARLCGPFVNSGGPIRLSRPPADSRTISCLIRGGDRYRNLTLIPFPTLTILRVGREDLLRQAKQGRDAPTLKGTFDLVHADLPQYPIMGRSSGARGRVPGGQSDSRYGSDGDDREARSDSVHRLWDA
jgi:hypothetical protein